MTYISPATRHRLAVEAAEHVGSPAQNSAGRSEYEVLLFQLKQDVRFLSTIQSQQAKAIKKAELLKKYDPWLNGVLGVESPKQDDAIFTTCLIWHIDAGLLDRAAVLAMFAIKNQFNAPDGYSRTMGTIIFEEMADMILKGASISIAGINAMSETLKGYQLDMPDKCKSKWYKAAGQVNEGAGRLSDALLDYQTALSLDQKAGVKKDISRLEALIKKN